MSGISYFQKYSQKENHATNNTLVMLRHIYRESPIKLEEILNALTDAGLSMTPVFRQQERLSSSVPDGSIKQQPMNIFFEAKRDGGINEGQIKRHISSIKESDSSSSTKILFALTKEKQESRIVDELEELAKENSIVFSAITFSDIVNALRENCAEHETNLHDVIDDYENFLSSEGLLRSVGESIYCVPVGTSMNENKKFSLYFYPTYRPLRTAKFFGLYTKKNVRYVGRVATVVPGQLDETGQFKVEEDSIKNTNLRKPTDEELQRITDAIKACNYYPELGNEPHWYYLFDELEETMFPKTSFGGLLRGRERNLSTWLDYSEDKKEYSTAEVAEKLRTKEF